MISIQILVVCPNNSTYSEGDSYMNVPEFVVGEYYDLIGKVCGQYGPYLYYDSHYNIVVYSIAGHFCRFTFS